MTPHPYLQRLANDILCDCVHVLPDIGRIAASTCQRCCGRGVPDLVRDKVIKRNNARRIPTWVDLASFTGAHCGIKYRSIGADWRCPCCQRRKHELMRWSQVGGGRWAVGLHGHHDHGPCARFPEILICEQCNNADSVAKRKLELPKSFSFSPAEIGRFVVSTAHGWHLINYDVAARIYNDLTAARQISPTMRHGLPPLAPPPPPPRPLNPVSHSGLFWPTGKSRGC